MDPKLLNIILCIPFAIVFIIAAILFLVSGYKRGIWRALISFGVTVVSAAISLVLAKIISKPLSEVATGLVKNMDIGDLPISEEMFFSLVSSVVSAVVAIILFSVLLFIFCLVGKILAAHLKSDKLRVEKKSLKWAGLGVRLVDAVVYTLLLVLPLYGSLATYAPTIEVLMSTSGSEESKAIVETITKNPIVQASGSGPASLVYGELSKIEVGKAEIDIVGVTTAVTELKGRVDKITSAKTQEEKKESAEELIDYAREELIDKDWFYDMVIGGVGEIKNEILKEAPEGIEEDVLMEAFELLDVTKEEFEENADVVLDFAHWILEEDLIDNPDVTEEQMEEVLGKIGELINSTDKMVEVKSFLTKFMVMKFMETDAQKARGEAILQKIISTEKADKDDYLADAEFLMALMSASSRKSLAQALVLHPEVSEDEVSDWLSETEVDFGPESDMSGATTSIKPASEVEIYLSGSRVEFVGETVMVMTKDSGEVMVYDMDGKKTYTVDSNGNVTDVEEMGGMGGTTILPGFGGEGGTGTIIGPSGGNAGGATFVGEMKDAKDVKIYQNGKKVSFQSETVTIYDMDTGRMVLDANAGLGYMIDNNNNVTDVVNVTSGGSMVLPIG
ncbi:MAG: CvpA family protein [Clostridiales bacterium]|nr:CvpA family protein [Clostridiales bacterium]